MRVLLDESIPVDFAQDLTGLDAQTVIGLGWAGLENGALLRRAAEQYQVLVTMDKNLQFQQNLAAHAIGVVLVRARSNRIDDLRPLVPQIIDAVAGVAPGNIRIVNSRGDGCGRLTREWSRRASRLVRSCRQGARLIRSVSQQITDPSFAIQRTQELALRLPRPLIRYSHQHGAE